MYMYIYTSHSGVQAEYIISSTVNSGNDTWYFDIEPWIYSRYVRLIALDWNGNVSLRMELYGCQQEELLYCEYDDDMVNVTYCQSFSNFLL